MPIFEVNGQQYEVEDRYTSDFAKEFPSAVTRIEKDDHILEVAAGDYSQYLSSLKDYRHVVPEKAMRNLIGESVKGEYQIPSWIARPPQSSQYSKPMQSTNSISVPKSQMLDMDIIVRQNKDERTQKTKMAQYLKAQGYKREDIISILKTVTAE